MNDQPIEETDGDQDKIVTLEMRRATRRSFLAALVAASAGYAGWRWLGNAPQIDGVPWPLRRMLQNNEHLARGYFNEKRLSPEFQPSRVQNLRSNGEIGLAGEIDPALWRLRVEGLAGNAVAQLTLADIQALPRHEMITELRCIEGWSIINQWAGARLSDLVEKHPPATRSGQGADYAKRRDDFPEYVGLSTPDAAYYVGLDAAAAMHPQTLLCYEMNGHPLTPQHGAPLRLAIPVKYGIKNLKRIGTLRFSQERPPDYWAENGYDYYAGL